MSIKINVANPADKAFTTQRFLFCFGAYGSTYVLAYGYHLDGAFDEAVDWLVDNAPGLLADEQVAESFNEAKANGASDEEAWDEACTDVTFGGNCSNAVLSWEWGIVLENPTNAQLVELYHGRPEAA
jgi:hypothetical protein